MTPIVSSRSRRKKIMATSDAGTFAVWLSQSNDNWIEDDLLYRWDPITAHGVTMAISKESAAYLTLEVNGLPNRDRLVVCLEISEAYDGRILHFAFSWSVECWRVFINGKERASTFPPDPPAE
jgi:hypothetical protein